MLHLASSEDVAYDGGAGRTIADDDILVEDVLVGVGSFSVTVCPSRHEAVDGGYQQPAEDDQTQHIDDAVFDIVGPFLIGSGFFYDGDLIDIGFVLCRVENDYDLVGDFLGQHLVADEVGESGAYPRPGEEAQGKVKADDEDKQSENDLFARVVGENPVDE